MNLQFASRRDLVSAMFNPDPFFLNSLADLKADGWYQTFLELERRAGAFPLTDRPGRSDPVVVWCSNDYLGMGQYPVVLAASHQGFVDRVGTGVGGVPATSQAKPVITSCSSASLRTCTARRRPLSSPPAM